MMERKEGRRNTKNERKSVINESRKEEWNQGKKKEEGRKEYAKKLKGRKEERKCVEMENKK